MIRSLLLLFLIMLHAGLETGCASKPGPRLTGAVRYFNIRADIAPRHLIVQIGDEVRWQNLNQHPVRLRMLEDNGPELIACEIAARACR